MSTAINTAFVERQNGTDRHRSAPGKPARRTGSARIGDSMQRSHLFDALCIQFLLAGADAGGQKDDRGHSQARSPAMAAGLADHVWSMTEWFSMPAVRLHDTGRPRGGFGVPVEIDLENLAHREIDPMGYGVHAEGGWCGSPSTGRPARLGMAAVEGGHQGVVQGEDYTNFVTLQPGNKWCRFRLLEVQNLVKTSGKLTRH